MLDLFPCVAKRLRVYVRSVGCDDRVRVRGRLRRVSGCGRARFRVGRRDYSPSRGHRGRGFNIVVIDGMTGKHATTCCVYDPALSGRDERH